MLYIKVGPTGLPLAIKDGSLNEFEYAARDWQSRWEWKTFEEVERLARYVTAMKGELYLAVDQGPHHGPRYDVMRCPQIGDPVSYGFNGDYYPDGYITAITKNLQITTSEGHKYRRKGTTSGWLRTGGTWGLVHGHIDERNPHF